MRGPKSAIQKWRDTILSIKPDLIEHLSQSANDEQFRRVAVRFKLAEYYGNPPIQGGGIMVGESFNSILEDLKQRYGGRLIDTKLEGLH